MGRASLGKMELINELSEVAGYKTGLVITYRKMKSFITSKDLLRIYESNRSTAIGIRPEEYEEIYYDILRGAGYIPRGAFNPSPYYGVIIMRKYGNQPEKFMLAQNVYELFIEWLHDELSICREYGSKMSPENFMKKSYDKYGRVGYSIALEIVENFSNYQESSPWSQVRRVEWKDSIELEELFKSESLETYYGKFIDQRYIDYLSNNLDDIGKIQWRKFEALTCEYFDKLGYYVEIGKGRDDGGVDARVWKDEEDKENPPMILIQCKREKSQVERVVIKALWADTQYEKAKSGLIVTSSKISRGAREDCIARGYNIRFAERDTLNKWLQQMRTPYHEIVI